jgi:histidinol-phosphate/aromatic aminotransferase/cobyric acid decarboxylase-like protein
LIYLSTPNIYGHILDRKTWYEVDTENDLEMANYLFSKKDEKIYKLENLYGGYWRYDFLDFCFLFNLYFPAQHFYSKFSNELPFLIGNYPSAQHKIRSLMSQLYTDDSFSKENILVGNGSSEFIRILNRNFIRKITIPVPSFNEYEDLDKLKINYFILPEKKEFMLEADSFIEAVIKSKSNYALIINPNNPTGSVIERDVLIKIIENLKHLDGIIVDESFIDFTGNRKKYSVQSLVNEYPNLILLRSLSKEFGIPGLRVGYLVSSNKDIKNKVGEYLPIWNINSLAEKFIELLPKYQKEYQKSIQKIINDKKIFCKNLKNIRMLKVFDGKANFVFCKILSKKINSTQLRSRENNILVNALKMIEREIGE